MGLLSAIKSALGLDDAPDRSGGTDVTVEREPDATSERAVKESGPDATGASEAAEADTTGPDETGTTSTEAEPAEERTDEAGAEPVEEIKGIGPAYADRLGEAGVGTVSELASADAADLAEATGIGESRLEKWISRAKAR